MLKSYYLTKVHFGGLQLLQLFSILKACKILKCVFDKKYWSKKQNFYFVFKCKYFSRYKNACEDKIKLEDKFDETSKKLNEIQINSIANKQIDENKINELNHQIEL